MVVGMVSALIFVTALSNIICYQLLYSRHCGRNAQYTSNHQPGWTVQRIYALPNQKRSSNCQSVRNNALKPLPMPGRTFCKPLINLTSSIPPIVFSCLCQAFSQQGSPGANAFMVAATGSMRCVSSLCFLDSLMSPKLFLISTALLRHQSKSGFSS